MSFFATWQEKLDRHRDALRRAIFAFLAIWVHIAAMFYLTMMLFTGHSLSAAKANPSPVKPHTVEISLAAIAQPAPPKTETPPEAKRELDPTARNQATATPAPPPQPPATEQPKVDEKPTQTAAKEGILDCDSLDKKPERIVLGPTYLDIPPQEDLSGEVVLRVKIHQNGTVLGVKVENSTMKPRVQEKVMQWVATSLFHPGEMGGVKVDCELRYEFSLNGPARPGTAN